MHKPMFLATTALLLFGLALAGLPVRGLAADPAAAPAMLTDEEREAQINALETEIAKLQDIPAARRLKELAQQQREVWDKANAALASPAEEERKLRATDEYRQYEEKQRDLYTRLNKVRDVAQEYLTRACRKFQAQRQAALTEFKAPPLKEASKLGFDVLNYPRLDGSTSTHPLAMLVTCRMFNVPCGWQTATERTYGAPRFESLAGDFDSGPAAGDYAAGLHGITGRPVSEAFMTKDYQIVTARFVAGADSPAGFRLAQIISSMLAVNAGTHEGYVNLVEGRSDLDLTVRPPSAEESKLAKDKGVAFTLTPVARDALVFMVSFKNAATALTSDQIRGVYLGKLTSWKELGGDGKEIQPLRREKNSGSQELLEALLLSGKPLPEYGRSIVAESMIGPFNALANNEAGIGFSVWYYEHFMAASPRIKLLSVDGVAPTRDTIASGKYPYVFPIYAALRQDAAPDSPAARLLAWLLTSEGQALVRESGYVPLKNP